MTLHVYTNDTDTVIAADLDDVRAIVEAQIGCTLEAEGWSLDDWRQVPDDKPLTIVDNEGDLAKRGETIIPPPPGLDVYPRVTKTCAEWVASDGRGFLCSTEF